MKVILGSYIVALILTFPLSGMAQEEGGNYDYSREFIWGITKNTSSGLIGGLVMKFGQEIKDGVFQTFGGELVNVKHPKEYKYLSQFSGNTFIWAKQSYLYALRLQYGREMIFYKKANQQGVQINGQLAAGPTFGILAPYYIEYNPAGSGGTITEQFDPERHNFNGIVGTGRLFQGLGESKIIPGINLKSSISFEFGTFKSNVTGFELGFMVEQYTKEVVIIPTADNQSFFPYAFITLFYGNRR
jgi:hypothetical protein